MVKIGFSGGSIPPTVLLSPSGFSPVPSLAPHLALRRSGCHAVDAMLTTQEEEARGAQARKKGKEKEKTLPQQQQCATYRQ